MMTKTFDPTKPVQTRGGRKARIICTDREGEWPIIALVESSDGEDVRTFDREGRWFVSANSLGDLVNIPEVTTRISNVYRFGSGVSLGCLLDLKDIGSPNYLGYLEWTLEDGEPVSARFVKDKS